MIYKGVNASWKKYSANPTPQSLEKLLESVRRQVTIRLKKQDWAYEDIAQNVVILVWQAIENKVYNPERGDLAAFVTTVARTQRINFHAYDRLMFVDESFLEKLQYNHQLRQPSAQDPIEFEDGVEK